MAESTFASPASQSETVRLPRDLYRQLWAQITSRLIDGEILLSNKDFQRAIEEVYAALTGSDPSSDIRYEIRSTVEIINRDHPETYLAQGMQNGVNRAFEEGVRRLNWDIGMIQAKGARTLHRFSQQGPVQDLLEELNLRPDVIDALERRREEALQPDVQIPLATSLDKPEEPVVAVSLERRLSNPTSRSRSQHRWINPRSQSLRSAPSHPRQKLSSMTT